VSGGGVEVNFDGLVGPTHNYAGLSEGNLASARNRDSVSRPRDAALEGIAKMRKLASFGIAQGVLPPQERPDLGWLRSLGFTGSDREVWTRAFASEPAVARAAIAASSMWAANAATVSPSADCADNRLHASVANLQTMLHRRLEAGPTAAALQLLLADQMRFEVHPALTAQHVLSDEGAANHMRMSSAAAAKGVEIFVYGRRGEDATDGFPARQTLEASRAVARRHQLDAGRTVFARQSRDAINAGAFHNDVVAVAHQQVLFYHQNAFADAAQLQHEIRVKAKTLFEPVFVEVAAAQVSLQDAVSSYLFNSQLVTRQGQRALTLICPAETRENNRTAAVVQQIISAPDAAIGDVEYVDVRESMRNGGGPACLRLRIEMTPAERAAAAPGFFITEALAAELEAWVRRHYRETLAPEDLADPMLVDETRSALDALTRILPLGSGFYPFQRA
jgi:succinylarginine dihydrolase